MEKLLLRKLTVRIRPLIDKKATNDYFDSIGVPLFGQRGDASDNMAAGWELLGLNSATFGSFRMTIRKFVFCYSKKKATLSY